MKPTTPAEKLRAYWRLMGDRAAAGHKSRLRQAVEMARLRLVTGNGPGFYQMAGFWRSDADWPAQRGHLGEREYRRRVSAINPQAYRKLTGNKLPEKALLTLLGFRTPAFVGFLHPARGRAVDGRPLRGAEDLGRLVAESPHRRLCFKKAEGCGGKGFEMAEILGGTPLAVRRLRTGEEMDAAAFVRLIVEKNGDVGTVVERALVQHAEMARFNPTSVNTCRIWISRVEPGPARVLLAYLRMGRGGALVDNQSSGGLVAPIDLQSGVLGPAIDGLPTRREFPVHPDHEAAIAGSRIPLWADVLSFAAECGDAIPALRFAGLDVALAEDGPMVLELNASPDREGAAFAGVPSGTVVPSVARDAAQ